MMTKVNRQVARLAALFLLHTAVLAQSVPGGTHFVGGDTSGGAYQLVDGYRAATFFDKFNFYNVWYDL